MGKPKLKMAIGGPQDVEIREQYKQRRYQETERQNLNEAEKIDPNPLFKKSSKEVAGEAGDEMTARKSEQDMRKNTPRGFKQMEQEHRKTYRKKDPFESYNG